MRLVGGSEAPDTGMKTLPEARRLVRQQFVPVVGIEVVPLAAARNRVLATNLVASVDLPPHDNAAMDGYAIRASDMLDTGYPRLRVVGHAAAGHPFDGEVADG
jgi:molybdopterin molybdotransferase